MIGGCPGVNLALAVATMPINAGPRARSPETGAWRYFGGTPVVLTLAPDAGDVPPLHGRLIRSIPGYFGVLRYLLELNEPLPSGFDPFGELPWFARTRRIEHLLVTPASHLPTLDTPSHFIGLAMARGEVVHVFVSIGPSPARLPSRVVRVPEEKYPFFAMGDLCRRS
jgi:hypothetical protein